jgi:hypothetical protein
VESRTEPTIGSACLTIAPVHETASQRPVRNRSSRGCCSHAAARLELRQGHHLICRKSCRFLASSMRLHVALEGVVNDSNPEPLHRQPRQVLGESTEESVPQRMALRAPDCLREGRSSEKLPVAFQVEWRTKSCPRCFEAFLEKMANISNFREHWQAFSHLYVNGDGVHRCYPVSGRTNRSGES